MHGMFVFLLQVRTVRRKVAMSAVVPRLRRHESERMSRVFTDGTVVVTGVDDYPLSCGV